MRRLWITYLTVSLGLVAVYPALGPIGRFPVYEIVGASSIAAILAGIRVNRLSRPLPWLLLAAGQAVFVAGDVLWDVQEKVQGTAPAPWIDLVYLSGYPLLAGAFGVLAHRRQPGWGAIIDAAVIGVGAGVLTWVLLMVPIIEDEGLTGGERLITAAYPLCDLILLALAARLLLTPGDRPRAFWFLNAGLLVVLMADEVYAVQGALSAGELPGTPLEVGWLLGYVLVGTAVLDPTVRRIDDRAPTPYVALTPARLALLACASLVAPAALFITGHPEPSTVGVAVGSAVAFLLVLLRMAGLNRRVQVQARELDRMAHTDVLTDLPNRRHWEERLPIELARAARADEPVCVVMLDLDHFKRFNDTNGHAAGDRLLSDAAAAWRERLRAGDMLARYGGEEFVLLLAGCDEAGAIETAERMRHATPEGQTCSAGLAVWDGREGPRALVARADAALYRAKKGGRDLTAVCPSEGAHDADDATEDAHVR